MWTDPIVEEVRRIRDERAAKNNYDLDEIYEAVRLDQELSGRVIVRLSSLCPDAPSDPQYSEATSENLAVAEAVEDEYSLAPEAAAQTATQEQGDRAA